MYTYLYQYAQIYVHTYMYMYILASGNGPNTERAVRGLPPLPAGQPQTPGQKWRFTDPTFEGSLDRTLKSDPNEASLKSPYIRVEEGYSSPLSP